MKFSSGQLVVKNDRVFSRIKSLIAHGDVKGLWKKIDALTSAGKLTVEERNELRYLLYLKIE